MDRPAERSSYRAAGRIALPNGHGCHVSRKSNQTWSLFNLVNFHQGEEMMLKSWRHKGPDF
jgi:hypothetical protein